MPRPCRIEGYAIVSEDGMIANAAGIMPDSLKFEADQHFFERGLDGVDVVVHGRHSHERQPPSYLRRRLILTRQVPAIEADPSNEKALFWNPAGASFEQALGKLPTSRPFSWTSDNGRVDAAMAPVDNVPCRSTRRARHIRADRPLTNNTGHSSRLAKSGRLVRRMSHRVDPAAIAEEARTVRLDPFSGLPDGPFRWGIVQRQNRGL
jgi:hypothetical protein